MLFQQWHQSANSVLSLVGASLNWARLLNQDFLPDDNEVLFHILKSEPESLFLGSVFFNINLVYGFGSGVINSRELGCLGNRVSFGVDEVD